MSKTIDDRFFVERVCIISFFKGAEKEEEWWSVTDNRDNTNCFPVRNKDTADSLCAFLNRQETIKKMNAIEIEARCNAYNRIIDSLVDLVPQTLLEELKHAPLLPCDYEGIS